MTTTRPLSNILSGVIGGLIVLVIGAVLIATNVIDTGDTKTVVRQVTTTQPTGNTAGSEGRTVRQIYEQEGKGVAFITSTGVTSDSESPFGLPQQGTATGSGFVVDKDGYIVTNAHVVEGADSVTVSFSENGEAIPAEVKGVDRSTDVAVLKVDPSKVDNLTTIPLGDSSKARVGDPTIAIGNPFGLSRTVTTGIVSGLQRQIQAPNGFTISNVIQTDAPINPGNSGGPLLDANGRVIGINSQIQTGGGQGSVGIGFAVPINTVKEELSKLKAGESIDRAYLGVQMQRVDSQLAEDLNLPVDHGALIVSVTPDSPADKAGLRGGRTGTSQGVTAGGDLIVAVDGKETTTEDAVANAIAERKPGDSVDITYYRGNDKKTTTVTLAKRPANADTSGSGSGGGGGGGGGGIIP
ncbi:MAG TPA: trypsin-like peptidase domain-containing protein [Thermoleophilaceae bacterium]|nr:trypsin-like peptidase domain-containing protein [Thermoleophilaceae bacterium]